MKNLKLNPLPLFTAGDVETICMPEATHLPGITIWAKNCKLAISSDPPIHPNCGGFYLGSPILLQAGNELQHFQFMPDKGAVITIVAVETGKESHSSAVLNWPCATREECQAVERFHGIDGIHPHPVLGFPGSSWDGRLMAIQVPMA